MLLLKWILSVILKDVKRNIIFPTVRFEFIKKNVAYFDMYIHLSDTLKLIVNGIIHHISYFLSLS